MAKYHLISSPTCPWVQRAVIVLRAKNVDFDVTYINLREKPDWFLEISPHGKVPVLKVDDEILFESNAIAEFLDESFEPRLHPADPIRRARNRAWTDFVPDCVRDLVAINYAKTADELPDAVEKVKPRLKRLEDALANERSSDGPYFNGADFSLVDAAYGPFFQRFAICEAVLKTGVLDQFPQVKAWSDTLLSDDRVIGAVPENFVSEYRANLGRRGAYVATLMPSAEAAE
ncbi:MAG: glutathione S-transferase family protein [Rhizobiales bacterium]|nr:glutathione S-transferase family protein [Hyphomicrobiales bacterium]